jgi:competence protein ComEC
LRLPSEQLQAARRALLILAVSMPLLLLVSLRLLHGAGTGAPGRLVVDVIDVGEGDCILIETPSGRTMLIDGGGSRNESVESDVGEQVVVPFLRSRGIGEINVLLITHPHGDHVGGLSAVLRNCRVDTVLDGDVLPYPSKTYQLLLAQIRADHIAYHKARRGETVDFGDGVRGVVLSPPPGVLAFGTGLDDKTINNYSAVIRLTYGRRAFLFDGDAEAEAEQTMLNYYGAAYLASDFLKVGHHGSKNASSDAWLSAVHPSIGAISCGYHNIFGHPHPDTLARLAAHHVQVFRTDLDGTIEVVSDGNTLSARALGK